MLSGINAGYRPWTPIGDIKNNYLGTFDGNNKTISGIYYNDDAQYVGIFGYVGACGNVQNVKIADSYLVSSFVSPLAQSREIASVGAIVGFNSGTVQGCANRGTVSSTADYSYVGGIAGNNTGTVQECTNSGTVSGNNYVGGIVGNNTSTVHNCYNTGAISGNNTIGGIVGLNINIVQGCTNSGTISGNDFVSGIVGINSGTVQNCCNTRAVSGNSAIGGIVGYNSGTVQNCYNTDTVSGSTDTGGIVGRNEYDGKVQNCFSEEGEEVGSNYDGTVGNCTDLETLKKYLAGEIASEDMHVACRSEPNSEGKCALCGAKITVLVNTDEGDFCYSYNTDFNTILQKHTNSSNIIVTLYKDVYGDVYLPNGVQVDLGGFSLGVYKNNPVAQTRNSASEITPVNTLIIAPDATVTISNSKMNGNIPGNVYVSEGAKLVLGTGVEIKGTITNNGTVEISAAIEGKLKFTKTGEIIISGGYDFKKEDFDAIELLNLDAEKHNAKVFYDDGNEKKIITLSSDNENIFENGVSSIKYIDLGNITLTNVPAEVVTDVQHRFFVASAFGLDMNVILQYFGDIVKYYYSFNADGSNAKQFNGDLYLFEEEVNGAEKVYVWAAIYDPCFTAVETEKHEINIRKLTSVLGTLDDAVARLETLLENGGTIDEIKGAIADINARLGALDLSGIQTNAGNIAALNALIEQNSGKLGGLESEVNAIKTTLEELAAIKERLDTVDGLIEEIKGEIATINTLITDGKLEEITNSITKINETLAKLEQFEAESEFAKLTSEISTLTETITSLTGRIEALEQLKADLEAKDNAMSEDISKLKAEMEGLKDGSATPVVALVIAIVSLAGNVALVAIGFVLKRKKSSISVK